MLLLVVTPQVFDKDNLYTPASVEALDAMVNALVL